MNQAEITPNGIINGVKKLPAAPRIIPKLQGLLRNPNSDLDDITKLIQLDASLSAQVLKLSNSAMFSARGGSKTIQEAVNRIGFNEVFRLVGAVAAKDMLIDELVIYNYSKGELWRHSIACAHTMQSLSYLADTERDLAYTMGLLHGLGKIVIEVYYREQGLEHQMSGLRSVTPEEEMETLGFTHAQVAVALLEKWNFLPSISEPIAYQINPMDAPPKFQKSALLLCLCLDAVVFFSDMEANEELEYDPDPDLLTELALTRRELEDVTNQSLEVTDKLIKSVS